MTEAEIKAIEERAARATEGPWLEYRCGEVGLQDDEACGLRTDRAFAFEDGPETWDIVGDSSYDECHHPLSRSDADFIVHARTDVPALCKVLREAVKLLRRTRGTIHLHDDMWLDNEIEDFLRRWEGK